MINLTYLSKGYMLFDSQSCAYLGNSIQSFELNVEGDPAYECLSFEYFMFGASVEYLEVHYQLNNAFYKVQWRMPKSVGEHWFQAYVPITHSSETNLTNFAFFAKCGSFGTSDVAVDNVKFLTLCPGKLNYKK